MALNGQEITAAPPQRRLNAATAPEAQGVGAQCATTTKKTEQGGKVAPALTSVGGAAPLNKIAAPHLARRTQAGARGAPSGAHTAQGAPQTTTNRRTSSN